MRMGKFINTYTLSLSFPSDTFSMYRTKHTNGYEYKISEYANRGRKSAILSEADLRHKRTLN